jgi:hypothetical protein
MVEEYEQNGDSANAVQFGDVLNGLDCGVVRS